MEQRQSRRVQQTRERLRVAAHQLFLQQGYLATSIDAILAEAGISSKETLYRHYANKEALFVDVLSHLTLEQPGFSEKLAALPAPQNLPQLGRASLALCDQERFPGVDRGKEHRPIGAVFRGFEDDLVVRHGSRFPNRPG